MQVKGSQCSFKKNKKNRKIVSMSDTPRRAGKKTVHQQVK